MKDILLDEQYDLIFTKGDITLEDSQNQSVELLLYSKQGEFKEYPEAGCNLGKANHGAIDRFLERNIRVQLEADNFKIETLNITEKGIDLKGEYADV